LSAVLRQRMTRGLSVLASFTWSTLERPLAAIGRVLEIQAGFL